MRWHPIRYKRNPAAPRPALRFGRKVMDEVTGRWTYEGRLVRDPYGYRTDPRFGGLDNPDNRSDTDTGGG